MKPESPEIYIVDCTTPDTKIVVVEGIGQFHMSKRAVRGVGGEDSVIRLTRGLVRDGWIRDSRVEFWGEDMIYGRLDGIGPGAGVLREDQFMPDDPRGFPDFPDL